MKTLSVVLRQDQFETVCLIAFDNHAKAEDLVKRMQEKEPSLYFFINQVTLLESKENKS